MSLLAVEPVVLDNGSIRVEFDPQVFSVRFVGLPGGSNYLEPLFVSHEDKKGPGWVDPGGLVTDLIPLQGHDASLRRGPGEIVEQRKDYVAALGPLSGETGLRVKKEIALDPIEAKARFTVTVTVAGPKPAAFSIRNTARVARGSTLRVEKADGTIRALAGTTNIFPAVVNSNLFWLVPVPPTAPMKNVVLGAFVPRIVHVGNQGIWRRRIVSAPEQAKLAPNESTFLCLLDDTTRSYGAALQGAVAPIEPCCPLVFEEEWTISKRGK